MSGKEERQFTKTDSQAKREAAKRKRKESDKKQKKAIGLLSGNASVVTDSSPIIKRAFPNRYQLKDFMISVESISQPQVKLVIERSQQGVSETTEMQLEEGVNRVDAVIDIYPNTVVSVYASHPGDFRVEDILFSAEIINL